ncbi:MAG TPA: 50S ribosomal protein L22 [Sphingobacteriaceae bacterium]|nr:50S ribosomal protein L22 [Sphingobacteriaceae bacterium]
MEARATARYVRLSPRKARLVIDLIRGKPVADALSTLRFTPRRASRTIEKVLRSAVANATHNYEMAEDDLYVAKAYVDEGPRYKRLRPRARGRRDIYIRPTAHITVVVKEREEG